MSRNLFKFARGSGSVNKKLPRSNYMPCHHLGQPTIQRNLTSHAKRLPVITPHWWTGVEPIATDRYNIDCSKFQNELQFIKSKNDVPQELINKMNEMYEKSGLVYLTNTGLTDVEKMQEIAECCLGGKMEYKGGANSRHNIDQDVNVYDTGAPGSAFIHYHHEMTYVSKSVKNIGFSCQISPENNPGEGWTYVSDQTQATDELLKTPFGQKLKEKGVCFIRCLTDKVYYENQLGDIGIGWNGLDQIGVYNHWQTSFGVETPEEVEIECAKRSLKVEWGDNRYCKTKYYVDAFEYHPETDRNYLYASLADDSMWFDTWPGLKDMPTFNNFNKAGIAERPLKMTFGDDTEFTRQELLQFIEIYDRFGLPIRWNKGDIAIHCNYRWAHGRPEYKLNDGDKRQLGVTLGQQFDRVGQRNDKW